MCHAPFAVINAAIFDFHFFIKILLIALRTSRHKITKQVAYCLLNCVMQKCCDCNPCKFGCNTVRLYKCLAKI